MTRGKKWWWVAWVKSSVKYKNYTFQEIVPLQGRFNSQPNIGSSYGKEPFIYKVTHIEYVERWQRHMRDTFLICLEASPVDVTALWAGTDIEEDPFLEERDSTYFGNLGRSYFPKFAQQGISTLENGGWSQKKPHLGGSNIDFGGSSYHLLVEEQDDGTFKTLQNGYSVLTGKVLNRLPKSERPSLGILFDPT